MVLAGRVVGLSTLAAVLFVLRDYPYAARAVPGSALLLLIAWPRAALAFVGLGLAVVLGPLCCAGVALPLIKWLRRKRSSHARESPPGIVIPVLAPVAERLRELLAGYWVGKKAPEVLAWFCEDRRTRRHFPITWGRREAFWTDAYVLMAAFLGFGVLAVLPFFPWLLQASWFFPLFCTLATYRLIEILVYALWAHVFERVRRGAGQPRLASPERFLVLNVVNYGEIVVLFAILWALVGQGLGAGRAAVWGALERSIRIATMVGFSNPPLDEHWVDRVLFASETAMALMFILFVLVRAVSVIRPRQ